MPAAEESLLPSPRYRATPHTDPHTAALEVEHSDFWLSDSHIDHAQYLLSSVCPEISGLQTTLVFETDSCKSVQHAKTELIQILHVNSNHWVTVSNINCNLNAINVYDSLPNTDLKNNERFNFQLASLLNCNSEAITVSVFCNNKQKSSSDCGVFAIACATSLAFGIAPESQHFVQEELRSYLAMCFRVGKMMPFPTATLSWSAKPSVCYEVLVCKICRRPGTVKQILTQCFLCQGYFHLHCGNGSEADYFLCSKCLVHVSCISVV